MEPLTAVMLILGCDHSMMVCRESNQPLTEYQTVQACEQAVDQRIREIDGYPVAMAKCLEVPADVAGQSMKVAWRFDRAGNLLANAEIGGGPRLADAAVDHEPTTVASAANGGA